MTEITATLVGHLGTMNIRRGLMREQLLALTWDSWRIGGNICRR